MNEKVITGVLGREYKPIGCNNNVQQDEVDEFTQTLLEQMGVRQCGNCGAQILREEGCRAMQCICGFRFCFECTRPIDQCECDSGRGLNGFAYFDNVTGVEGGFYDVPPLVAEPEQVLNLRDFLSHAREREQERRREAARLEEELQRRQQRKTAIFCTACMSGNIRRIQGMIRDRGISILYLEHFDRLPLYYAVRNGQTEAAKILMDAGAYDRDSSCLFAAANDECRGMLRRDSSRRGRHGQRTVRLPARFLQPFDED